MEVILYENIPNLGETGDIVNVKDGYARNFLIPRKKAVLADPSKIREMEHKKRVAAAKQTKMKSHYEEMAKKLAALVLTIAREAGEEEKLFGSVTSIDIVNALRIEGFTIDKKNVKLEEPIKKIGAYEVSVRLHPEVTGKVKVEVIKK